MQNKTERTKMSRIRLNQEYRNKIANRMRVHLEQENTQEKEKYLKAREEIKPYQDTTWKLAEQIVRRHYTPKDVEMAYHFDLDFLVHPYNQNGSNYLLQ